LGDITDSAKSRPFLMIINCRLSVFNCNSDQMRFVSKEFSKLPQAVFLKWSVFVLSACCCCQLAEIEANWRSTVFEEQMNSWKRVPSWRTTLQPILNSLSNLLSPHHLFPFSIPPDTRGGKCVCL